MTWIRPRHVTQKAVIRVLAAGFCLVVVLLFGASVVAFRSARLIQRDVAKLVREHLAMGRLVTEMQTQQAVLNGALFNLARDGESMDRDSLLARFNDSRAAFARILEASKGTPEEALWHRLSELAEEFSRDTARLADMDSPDPEALAGLVEANQEAIPIVARLIESGAAEGSTLEKQIERQSRRLVTESSLFLIPAVLFALVFSVATVKIAGVLFERMRQQAGELSRVSWQMLQGQEATARRFSHELHDELGQSLTAIKANLVAISPENLDARRADCLHLVDQAVSNVSELSQLLRPVILDDLGLDAGLSWLAEKFSYRTNVDVEYRSRCSSRFSDGVETHLFRIAQEALTNVARHSGATRVVIALEELNGGVRLRIEDNGHGLPVASKPASRGLGLFGMRARAEDAGGELAIRSSASGVAIEVTIPKERIRQHAEDEAAHSVG